MTELNAIETRYAGCRFRSRLEARWAVGFDALGIPWEYEPQGFELPLRLDNEGSTHYLPDFWLPTLRLWAEIKGHLTLTEYARLLNVAAALSAPRGGCDFNATGADRGFDLLVLGNPRAKAQFRLHMHKGDLYSVPWPPAGTRYCLDDRFWWWPQARVVGDDAVGPFLDSHAAELLTGNSPLLAQIDRRTSAWDTAREAALAARFEHGESGAR